MDNKSSKNQAEIINPSVDNLENSPEAEAELSSANASPPLPPPKDKKNRVFPINNRFLLAFVVLLVMVSLISYLSLRSAKNTTNTSNNKTQSLTSQQLADIANSTTVVGDSQQTLDVQSNSIFEGQVLMRSSLNVAGTIKVGGGLSLPSVTVGGVSSFGETQVNGSLSVAGATNLQGQVTLEKNLSVVGSGSFGSLSAGQLTITNLQLTGDFTLSRHLAFSGGTPSRSNGGALGSGGTSSVNGSDSGGTVTINTGSGPAAGCFITINFVHAFSSTPRVIISPSSAAAGSLDYYTNRSTGSFSICSAGTPAGASNYVFDYIVFD